MYVAENMIKCLLSRAVHRREVSVSGGSTVHAVHLDLVNSFSVDNLRVALNLIMKVRFCACMLFVMKISFHSYNYANKTNLLS